MSKLINALGRPFIALFHSTGEAPARAEHAQMVTPMSIGSVQDLRCPIVTFRAVATGVVHPMSISEIETMNRRLCRHRALWRRPIARESSLVRLVSEVHAMWLWRRPMSR
jgi:hypothetical protein